MSRPVTLPKAGESKPFPLNIPPDLAEQLHVFCEVTSAQWTKVIVRAVRDHLAKELNENPGVRSRFDEQMANFQRRTQRSGDKFRVVS